jgi:hypothetical protein
MPGGELMLRAEAGDRASRHPAKLPNPSDSAATFSRVTASNSCLQSRQRIVWTKKLSPRSARPETLARYPHLGHSNQ